MNLSDLNKVVQAMVATGKGLLAADESTGTIKKRFDAITVKSTEENRRNYSEMLFRFSDAMSKCISGVILYDETIWRKAKDDTPLVKLIEQAGAIPGIKIDEGTQALPNCRGEPVTLGLDKLAERLAAYCKQTARYAKRSAVIDIGKDIPSMTAIQKIVADVAKKLDQVVKTVGFSDDLEKVQRCEADAQAALGQCATANRSQPYYLDVTHRWRRGGLPVTASGHTARGNCHHRRPAERHAHVQAIRRQHSDGQCFRRGQKPGQCHHGFLQRRGLRQGGGALHSGPVRVRRAR